MTLDVRGFPLTFTIDSGPKILVDMQPSVIQRIVDDLLPRRGEAKQGFSHEADLAVKQASSQEDKGRLLWRSPSLRGPGCWTAFPGRTWETLQFLRWLAGAAFSLSGKDLSMKEFVEAARLV